MDLAAGTNMIRLCSSTAQSSNQRAVVSTQPAASTARSADKVIVLEESPSPQRSKTAPSHPQKSAYDWRTSADARPLATSSSGKAVDKEHSQRRVVTKKDGSREEARTAVKTRELIRPGRREKMTKRADARVR